MKRTIACLLTVSLCLLLKACDTTDPPDNKTLTLKLEDVSCTEAWIQLTTTNLSLPATLTLKKDNVAQNTILCYGDTLLYIDSLLPNQTYQYQASSIQHQVSSNEITVTTMDTTSHNFTFETFTFGGTAGSSTLYDVAIINENNIWAVGEILVADTSQNGYTTYNAVHWDGSEWELKRIKTNACGGVEYPPIQTIFAFSGNDILFAHIDGSITHYNGIEFTNDCSLITQLNGSANKIWGTSKNDYYVVSGNGFIAHYNGTLWSRIESGIELNIYDIWGDYNNETGEYEIIAVAANRGVSFDKAILEINETGTVTPLPTIGIPYSIHGIWFKSGKQYYISGAGMFNKKDINSSNPWNELEITNYYTEAISGNGINDIVVCGDFGELLHLNGVSWKSYQDFSGVLLLGVKIKDDQIVIVGIDNPKAFIAIGHR